MKLRLFRSFLGRWQWIMLCLAMPFMLFPSSRFSPILLFIPLLWLAAGLGTTHPLPVTPLNQPLLLLTSMLLVSALVTYDMAISLSKVAGLVLGLGMFFALVTLARANQSQWAPLFLFLTIGSGMAGLSLFGSTWVLKVPGLDQAVALMPHFILGIPGAETGFHPTEVAGMLLWVLPLFLTLLFLLFRKKPWGNRLQIGWRLISIIVLFFLITLFSAEFLLAQSRTAIIALAGTLILMAAACLPVRWRTILFGLLGALAISLGLFAWQEGWVQKLFFYTNLHGSSNNEEKFQDMNGRSEIWARAIYGIQDFPVTGIGMNTFRKVVNVLYPMNTPGSVNDVGRSHAHNEFLQAALDLGIPGLIAFLSLYLTSFWMLVRTWRWAESSPPHPPLPKPDVFTTPAGAKALVLGLGGGLLAHALFGLTDAVALGAKPGLLFWMLLALVTILYQQQRELHQNPEE